MFRNKHPNPILCEKFSVCDSTLPMVTERQTITSFFLSDLSDYDMSENDMSDYDMSDYDMSDHDMSDHNLSDHDLSDYDMSKLKAVDQSIHFHHCCHLDSCRWFLAVFESNLPSNLRRHCAHHQRFHPAQVSCAFVSTGCTVHAGKKCTCITVFVRPMMFEAVFCFVTTVKIFSRGQTKTVLHMQLFFCMYDTFRFRFFYCFSS